ncbi:hypothetical protein, partial [Romboutsia sp.]|uniref:hypothetical protein n=1 Tax=Romboutsia sp. TaxID=1965302 RepID=UPI003F3013FB
IMGQYILAAVCHKIKISKKEITKYNLELSDVLETLEKRISISCYDITEDENKYILKAKEEIFTPQNLASFIKEQGMIFNGNNIEEIHDEVITLKNYEEIVDLASEKPYESFQEHKGTYNVRCKSWYDCSVEVDAIVFFMVGKAYIECYNKLFNYLKELIKCSSKYEITGLMDVFLE